jgi:hypothetical protein
MHIVQIIKVRLSYYSMEPLLPQVILMQGIMIDWYHYTNYAF